MRQYRFYENIKPQLEERWIPIDEQNNKESNRIGMKPHKFGLIVWDWEKQFEKNIKKLESMGSNNDPNAYRTPYGLTNQIGIPFQYIETMPTWAKTSNWTEISEVMGRFESQSIYGSSAAQMLSIGLNYYAESSSDKHPSAQTRNEWTMTVIERIKFQLQSLVFPQYDGKFSPPVKVLLNIGNIFVDIPVVITSLTIEEGPPYEMDTMRSMFKKVTIEMRTSYPAWQTLSAPRIWTANDGGIFARQELERF